MKSFQTLTLGLLLLAGSAGLVLTSIAKTPDGETPAEETVCDEVSNSLFGLCNAYCEAMDCDYESPNASEKACEAALSNYMKKSGGEPPPCEDDGDPGDTGDTGEPGECYINDLFQLCCPDANGGADICA